MQWTTWTRAVTSTRSWICITRCSVLQCVLSTCHTWEMRWEALNAVLLHKITYHIVFLILSLILLLFTVPLDGFVWYFTDLFLIFLGLPGKCPAACPDRTPDALPPAPIPSSYFEDWKWRGEICDFIFLWLSHVLSSLPDVTFSTTPPRQGVLSHFPQSQAGGPHHHLFSMQLLSNDPNAAGAEYIFRLSKHQYCLCHDVVYTIVHFERAFSLNWADAKVQTDVLMTLVC